MPVDREGARLSLKLLEVRQKLGLTQAAMAYYLEVNRLTYWRWEKLGVPKRIYLRKMIKLVLEKMQRRASWRKYKLTAASKASQKAWYTRKRMKEIRAKEAKKDSIPPL
jgi:DNA-binding XRE family transcriptional regulator